MTPLLWRASRRHFRRHPGQLALAVLGIALGVAVVTAVDLSIESARRAFALSVDAVSGRATHQVSADASGLPDGVYTAVRVRAGVRAAAPVVEGWVRVTSGSGFRTLRLLGVDPFAEAPFRTYADARSPGIDPGVLIAQPGSVLLSNATAAALGLAAGDTFDVQVDGVRHSAVLAGTLDPADALARQAIADLVLADIATAQELLGAVGRIDRIDLRVPPDDSGAALLERVRAVLPPSARITTIAARAQATAGMTRAFELNLTALGLLALVFGTFLIYNSMTFGVLQRRSLIGLLRAQGVTRREVLAIVLVEAATIGTVAAALGLLAGRVLAGGLVGLVTQTINDLYFRVGVSGVPFTAASVVKGLLLGVGATVVAALPAAREAANTAPRQVLLRSALETTSHRTARRAGLLGAMLVVAGVALLRLPVRSLAVGLGALFVVIFGAALLAPIATVGLAHAIRPLLARPFGLVGRMAAGGVAGALSRTGPAIAALTVAIAAGAAIAIMIGSFRDSVERWLDATLRADVYIATPSTGANRREGGLDSAFVARIRATPGVAGISTYHNVPLETEEGEARLVAVDLEPRHRDGFTWLQGDPARVWAAFATGAVLVSEPFAYRYRVDAGDTITLPTSRGPRSFAVAAVFRDYATEFGVVFIDRATYLTWWDDAEVSSVAAFATAGVAPDVLMERLRALDTGGRDVLFQPSGAIRAATLRVFDRTFAITAVLRILALVVALVGVLAALMALQLERTRELGVLRATGFTPGQVTGLIVTQSGILGLIAGVLSLPLAAALAWAMIDVVNRRAFGWTIDLRVPASPLAESVALAFLAAIAAGLWPALRMARTRPADALREE